MVSVRITDIRHKKLTEGQTGITNANEMFLFVHGKKGLVREIGVSNFGVGQMQLVKDMGIDICVNELAYNLIHRGAELAVFPYTEKNNIGIMAYMPLMQGILSGKYDTIEEIPVVRRRTLHFDSRKNDQIAIRGGPGMEDALETFLADLKAVSKESGISCSALCISWILSHSAVSTVLAGCPHYRPAGRRM